MLAALPCRTDDPEPIRGLVPTPRALARMSATDRELEAQIAAIRRRLVQAQTSFGRRMALVQLDLLEGRRSPVALRAIATDKAGPACG
jgi:hypothetical protein